MTMKDTTPSPPLISKWAKLKDVLQDKTSLESSVDFLRTKTINQFSSECHKIYKNKLKIQYIQKNNSKLLSSKAPSNFKLPQITIKDAKNDLTYSDWIEQFLFAFRSNSSLMVNLIECLTPEQYDSVVPFLCHFFYENFYSESIEQEELLNIIYLLLEKEIDDLYTPSINSFLSNGFLGKFLLEFANRHEIKCYINHVVHSLIKDLESSNGEYEPIDLLTILTENDSECSSNSKLNKKHSDNNNNNELRQTFSVISDVKKHMSSPSVANEFRLSANAGFMKRTSTIRIAPITEKLHENYDYKYALNEKTLRQLLETTSNPLTKEMIMKQLRLCRSSSKNDLFSFMNYLNELNKINHNQSSDTIDDVIKKHNRGINTIKGFIENVFLNLSNERIIPYSIKCICKMIKVLMQKKFEGISQFEINIFICEFLLGKLILPLLMNPDINELGCDMLITMDTRKNLVNIYHVLKKISHGELFSSENDPHLTIFNMFIIDQVGSLSKYIDKFTAVKLPSQLERLVETFCSNSKDAIQQRVNVSYDYFKENPNDFMQHQSICFQLNELITFIDVVHANVKKFVGVGYSKEFEISFKSLHEFKDFFQRKLNATKGKDYYVLINDIFTPEKKQLLTNKETVMKLPSVSVDEMKELKYAITLLLSHTEMLPHSDWVVDDLPTRSCFDSIYQNIQCYKNINNERGIPLYWYGLYILNKLDVIPQQYKENDYQLLYDEIMKETETKITLLKELTDFLTMQVTSKFRYLQQKINITKQTLEKMKLTELSIKTLRFIYNEPIEVCLMKWQDQKEYKVKSKETRDEVPKHDNQLVIERTAYCVHSKLKVPYDATSYHCSTVKDFAMKLKCYDDIYEDINEDLNLTKADEILHAYLSAVEDKLCKHSDFIVEEKIPQYNPLLNMDTCMDLCRDSVIVHPTQPQISLSEISQKKALELIKNYILKQIALNETMIKKYNAKDTTNFALCTCYNFLHPIDNLNISKKVYNNDIFNVIVNHMKKMDLMKTPQHIMNEFGLAVGLMSSLITLTTGDQAQADDLIGLTVYGFIRVQPKRLIWNRNFTKYFLSDNDKMTDIGYNLTQITTSIQFIKSITGSVVHMDSNTFAEQYAINYPKNFDI